MLDRNKLSKFADKNYRDGFMHARVRGGIAYQIQALRAKFGPTQTEFAERTGKKQSVISRLEQTEYGKVNIQTLLDIASSVDVALVVQFVSYPEFLKRTSDMSPSALQPATIYESLSSSPSFADARLHEGLYNFGAPSNPREYPLDLGERFFGREDDPSTRPPTPWETGPAPQKAPDMHI